MCHPEIPPGQEAPTVKVTQVEIPTGGVSMPATVSEPDLPGSPSILIVADIFGVSPFYENLAARLAAAGFTALLPELFFRQAPLPERTSEAAMARRQQLDENQSQRDLLQAIDWLAARNGGGPVGTIGFCMGGTQTLDLTTQRDDLVTVTYYGFPARLPNATELTAPAPLEVVDRIHGPILGFWGDQDHAAGIDNVNNLRSALAARSVETDFHIYPGMSHGFMAASGLDPDKAGYDAACDAWTKTLAYLRHHLMPNYVTA
ncbi:MAG: dienelactone hydrolase family protein [Candidatus Dormibacteraceae bacterium]